MIYTESSNPFYPDASGAPLDGYAYYGTVGGNPVTSPVTVYWDVEGTQPASQPIQIARGRPSRNGSPARVWVSGPYSLLVQDRKLRQVLYVTNVPVQLDSASLGSSNGAAQIGFSRGGTGAVLRTTDEELSSALVKPEQYGAERDGSTDDATAILNAKAIDGSVALTGGTYQIASNVNFGASSVFGRKDSAIRGKGITFDPSADFYDSVVTHVKLDGTGSGGAETGFKMVRSHRVLVASLVAETYYQSALLQNAFLTMLQNSRFEGCTYGALFEIGCNGLLAQGCSFNGNDNHGAYVRGSRSVTFQDCDFEYNYVGIVLSNNTTVGGEPAWATGKAAEPRANRVVNGYFEGNTNRDIWIGDQAGSDRVRGAIVAFNYFEAGTGTVHGIVVDKSDSAKLIHNYFATTYDPLGAKIFLRADSRNTTIIPFPYGAAGDIADAEVTVEVGATVSLQTIQAGTFTMVLDGAGNGYADVVFKAPFDSDPPLSVTVESTTDDSTAPPPFRVNNKTTDGFRVRVIGGTASATVSGTWRAGQ